MRAFLLSAIELREKLIKAHKSHIDEKWALTFMKHLKFWIANGTDCKALSIRWNNEIKIILSPTWVSKYEKLKTKINLTEPWIKKK